VNKLVRLSEVLDIPADYLTEPPERQVVLSDLSDRLSALEAEVVQTRDDVAEALDLLRRLATGEEPDQERQADGR
jgi:hypothetical protein